MPKGLATLMGILVFSAGLGGAVWYFTQSLTISVVTGLIVLCLLLQRATAEHTKIFHPSESGLKKPRGKRRPVGGRRNVPHHGMR